MMDFAPPTPLDFFAALVSDDDQLPLLEAAVSIAQDEYPDLDVQQVLGDVDQLLARVRRRLPPDAAPLQRLRGLNQFFFRDLGFGGNVNHYYDPDNSHLNAVLRTRRGIPISLAVLWLELAQGLGLSARGVNFPGHFMVKVNLPRGQVVIDPFTGQSLRHMKNPAYASLTFVRPGLIGGERAERRRAESLSILAVRLLGPVLPRRWRLVPAERIAHHLVEAALAATPGVTVLESEQLQ